MNGAPTARPTITAPRAWRSRAWWMSPAGVATIVILAMAVIVGTVGVNASNAPMVWIGGVMLAMVGVTVGAVLTVIGYGPRPVPAVTE